MHNPLTDANRSAVGSFFAARAGRNALRIRRGSGIVVQPNGTQVDTTPSPTTPRPVMPTGPRRDIQPVGPRGRRDTR